MQVARHTDMRQPCCGSVPWHVFESLVSGACMIAQRVLMLTSTCHACVMQIQASSGGSRRSST